MALLKWTLALCAMAIAASVSVTSGKSPLAATAASYRVTVLSIGDGDTLRVQAGGRSITIRLACNREGCALAQA